MKFEFNLREVVVLANSLHSFGNSDLNRYGTTEGEVRTLQKRLMDALENSPEENTLKYPFEAHKMKTEDDEFWVARSKGLTFCIGDGKTIYEAIANLEENEKVWIETARYFGNKIPPVLVEEI